MDVRSRASGRRLLPHGPLDLLRQIALFAVAYQVYRLTRGIADDPGVAATAFANARDLIDIERALNLFIEPSVQTFVVRRALAHGRRVAGCTSTRRRRSRSAR